MATNFSAAPRRIRMASRMSGGSGSPRLMRAAARLSIAMR